MAQMMTDKEGETTYNTLCTEVNTDASFTNFES